MIGDGLEVELFGVNGGVSGRLGDEEVDLTDTVALSGL